VSEPFVLGWEEWLELPELGLPAIKAKVDTGARTSALHAFAIEEIGTRDRPRVRFSVHPIPGRDDFSVVCVADVIDQRDVVSSNGEAEHRYVIRTPVRVAGRTWPIEITLAKRESMSYRMLLGRQAVRQDMYVDPRASSLQPRLSYRAYGAALRSEQPMQPQTIALLSRRPDNPTNRRLVHQAELRGHSVPVIDRRRLSLYIAAREPAIFANGRLLEPLDAVIFRAGRAPSPFSLAVVRQM
jgi:ribosomal protein S6--L-glutamate ligase